MRYNSIMKISKFIPCVLFISLVLFVGCSTNNSELEKEYVDITLNECKRIIFSCDETVIYVKGGTKIKERFIDEKGCGCEEVFYSSDE